MGGEQVKYFHSKTWSRGSRTFGLSNEGPWITYWAWWDSDRARKASRCIWCLGDGCCIYFFRNNWYSIGWWTWYSRWKKKKADIVHRRINKVSPLLALDDRFIQILNGFVQGGSSQNPPQISDEFNKA